jgi:glycosyltransferase involved in cell wall biosynthesis
MRIAVIHSFYRSAVSSGENNTVLAQVEALRGAGHEVELIAQYTDENRKRNPFYPLKAGFDVATGNGYDPIPELEKFQPDVVRVHNLFPNFGTNWLERWKGPIMATLHNYRPVCANGVLFRDGAICTLCPDGKPLSSFKYSCYKNSRLATAPLTLQISKGLLANPVIARADKLVVLSKRSFAAYQRFGLDPSRMAIIPNFVNYSNQSSITETGKAERWVVASRLANEKGVSALVRIWPNDRFLDIYGDGDERASIIASTNSHIRLFEKLTPANLAMSLPSYFGMVFPSRVWENVPGAVLMAFSCGLPVVALEGSVGADLVTEFGAGRTYRDSATLLSALNQVAESRDLYGKNALSAYVSNFTESIWLSRTLREIESIASLAHV